MATTPFTDSEKFATPPLEPSMVALLDHLSSAPAIDGSLAREVNALRTVWTGADPHDLFLTVVVRTQGVRIEALKDALLCLSAQTDEDFEVMVVVHDAEPAALAEVHRVLERQSPRFGRRIRVLAVHGGYRARPLNQAIRTAGSRYVAFFDDDDLVMANWVEEFHRVTLKHPGRLVRGNVGTQQMATEVWADGKVGFRSVNWPKAEYELGFDQLAHLQVNHSPFMSWAFPTSLFTRLGLEFDETLAVCEDWDMILRASFLLGVEDVGELTAIYRRWEGTATSYTLHSTAVWRESEARVIQKLDESVLLLPPGSATRIRDLISRDPSARRLALMESTVSWRVTRPLRTVRRYVSVVGGRLGSIRRRLGRP